MEEPETRDTWVVTGAPKLRVPGGGGRQELEYFEKLAWVVPVVVSSPSYNATLLECSLMRRFLQRISSKMTSGD